MKQLNVGCGRDYREGWMNVDISRDVKAEHHFDIRRGMWPFYDVYFDEIYISGVLEQVGDNDEFIHVMNECHRVLKPGGLMTVIVPNAKYAIAHRDPMDVRKFTPETFAYFGAGMREYKLYGSVYGFKEWRTMDVSENDRHILTVSFIK